MISRVSSFGRYLPLGLRQRHWTAGTTNRPMSWLCHVQMMVLVCLLLVVMMTIDTNESASNIKPTNSFANVCAIKSQNKCKRCTLSTNITKKAIFSACSHLSRFNLNELPVVEKLFENPKFLQFAKSVCPKEKQILDGSSSGIFR